MVININKLKCRTIIGIHDWEKKAERELLVNLKLEFDATKAAKSDSINDTLDYDSIAAQVQAEVAKSRFGLLEKLAAHLLEIIIQNPLIQTAEIEIIKPNALNDAESVSVSHKAHR